jgi:hypothetical protein
MTESDLVFFKSWFAKFCTTFHVKDKKEQMNITLKEEHTRYVCENILAVARGESLRADEMLLAETVALFHDIGRFPQYAKYRTFKDSASVNHGLLGANTLIEQKVLDRLPARERDIIIDSVKFHNALAIADIADAGKILFLKLIRDADKLDIWRVFIGYYESPEEERPDAVALGLDDMPAYSRENLSLLRNRGAITFSGLRSLNDFKLMQLSWIFDLNFTVSFRLLTGRDYISRIAAKLPQTDEILDAVALLNTFAMEKSGNG